MEIARQCDWRVTTTRAREIQEELAGEISRAGQVVDIKLVAGVDISVNRSARTGTAAVVLIGWLPALCFSIAVRKFPNSGKAAKKPDAPANETVRGTHPTNHA